MTHTLTESMAQQFVQLWPVRTRRHLSASRLAKRYIDERVTIKKENDVVAFEYIFSDGSSAKTRGRGGSFKIWLENGA